ncbi:MAG TPA: TIR domain-containing protein [Candidatus Saccharimonadia bacterium]|nr:TIR domain-containing protein [Candidatus Saccharimonadia bacterium]
MNPNDALYNKLLYGNSNTPYLPQLVKIAQPQPIRIAKPRVFVSFDYENDAQYKFLLSAWNKNSRFQFTFQDKTPQEIQTNAVDRVKAVLTAKVKEATYTLVIVGQYATQLHKDAQLIGCTNWINYEIQQSNLYKRKVIAVRLKPYHALPYQLNYSRGYLVEGFNQANILNALALLKQIK